MKNFEHIQHIIKTDPNWEDKIRPWMKSIYPVEFQPNWRVLMYNLMNMPDDESIFKIACECRGTVVDITTGEVICAPFTKFWNYKDKGVAADIDWSSAWATHKRDGWIYKAFKYKGNIYWMSNGRVITQNEKGAPVDFVPGLPRLNDMSDVLCRAIKVSAEEAGCEAYFNGKFLTSDSDWCKRIPEGATVMFELESPWNRVHTDLVKDAKLWLIGFRLASGDEMTMFDAKKKYGIPYATPAVYNFNNADEMLKVLSSWTVANNGEGVVVCDKNFNRVKVKIDDYVRIKFESRGEDFGDNRLFRYYLAGEVDDLCAADEKVKARVDEIDLNVRKFEMWLSDKKIDVRAMLEDYPEKKDFVKYVNEKYEGSTASLYIRLYDRDVYDVKDMYFDSWKSKRTGYRDMLHMMGMRLTDGNEIDD